MSTEIILHPTRASAKALKGLLSDLGFLRAEHLWNWPKGSSHFTWFDHVDYRSFDGVEATIYPPSEEEQEKLGPCPWALHTRTRASASPADKAQQNQIIRVARRRFGGNFYNDWYGKNRYIPIHDDPRDARCRGIYLTYTQITEDLRKVRFALPEPRAELESFVDTQLEPLATIDPTRVLYNALVPFAIAGFEGFFSRCFVVLLQHETHVRERLVQDTRKVTMSDAIQIEAGERTVEEIVAARYSFQNLNSMCDGYKTWLNIDTWKVFRRRKKIGRKIVALDVQLQRLLAVRHGIVHHFRVDRELRKEGIEEILDCILVAIDVFIEYLEKDYLRLPIRDSALPRAVTR